MEKHHFAEPIFWIFCCCSKEHMIFLESITYHSHDKGRLCHALIGEEFMMGPTALLLLAFVSFFSGGCYCQYLSHSWPESC